MPLDSNHVSTLPFLVGEVKFMSGTQTPAGFVKANGQLLSRSQHPLLWAYAQSSGLLAATDGVRTDGQYSPGDGSTNFRVPDYRGEFIRCFDDGKGKDPSRTAGSLQGQDVQPHAHALWGDVNGGNGGGGRASSVRQSGLENWLYTEIAGGAETRPRNVALPVFIYAGT